MCIFVLLVSKLYGWIDPVLLAIFAALYRGCRLAGELVKIDVGKGGWGMPLAMVPPAIQR